MVDITDPESVAEHSFRTAILGYILASLEGVDPLKTATMCHFHDTQEARVNELRKLAQRYINLAASETLALAEQVERLPDGIANVVLALMRDYERQVSPEARIAYDADRLEYKVQGYADVPDWIDGCRAALKTDAARLLADECLCVEPNEWWQGLKKLTDE